MIKGLNSKVGLKGWTENRLFDGKKLEQVKRAIILDRLSQKEIDKLLDWATKPMFKGNFLWKLARKYFNVDLQIPFLFGMWTKKAIRYNLVPTRGKRIVADQIGGTTTTPVTAIAIGIGATAAAAGDTALGSEITTGGGSRGAATVTNTTTTTTGDTEQWVKSFTFSSGFAVTEEGLFDNNTSGGNLLARQVFSAVNVVNTDVLQITHKVQVT